MVCPKCGSSVLDCQWRGLSTIPSSVDYVQCGNGHCDWDNLEEQKQKERDKYPELFRPIQDITFVRPKNWRISGDGWEVEWKRG